MPPARSARRRRAHNLPQPLTSFIGREREIAEARRLFAATRLLTLTGTGGVGKTRLGHEVAASLLDDFEDGVWLVELAALVDPHAVPQAVATVLDVCDERERPLIASLAATLRPKRLLLILDNCERLIEACADLADALLRACPGLRIVATSRQPLGIAGETTFRVPSLSLRGGPDEGPSSTAKEDETRRFAEESEAGRLFVERARAAVPGFTLTERNSGAVEQICRRLDGIPLAIELAATRVGVLHPEQIVARLDDRFRLLTGGSRTALPRYRTLRALVDWSHDLLEEGERILLRRLSVFAGGWTLAAAESVCAGDGLGPDEVFDLVSGLVAKSLVLTVNHADEVRYRFLETLREYASEKLVAANEESVLLERRRDWFLALAERTQPALEDAEAADWFDRLDADRDNFRAVERRANAGGDAETVVRLGAALWQFWWMHGDAVEGRERIDAIVAQAPRAPLAPTRVKALTGASALARLFGDFTVARTVGEESLALARQLGDRRAIALAALALGRVADAQGRYADAEALQQEALAIFRHVGHRAGIASALNRLGSHRFATGDLAGSRVLLEESLVIARELGYPRLVGSILYDLGLTAHFGGDHQAARQFYEEWRAINTGRGNRPDLARILQWLGHLCVTQGDLPTARALFRESLVIASESWNRRRLVMVVWTIATLAVAERDWERAVWLHASAAASAEAIDVAPAEPMRQLCDGQLELARRQLGDQRVAAVAAAARALTLERVVDEARCWLSRPPSSEIVASRPAHEESHAPRPATPSLAATTTPLSAVGVTRREQEVIALVARGLTNRQIADELVITEGTAANHVKHILARLCLDSRVQIATWAIEHGLHRLAPRDLDAAS